MVSVREFARHVGRDQALILRLTKKGVIPRNEDGTIPLEAGLAAFEAYDTAPKSKGGRPKKGTEEKQKTPPKPVKETKDTAKKAPEGAKSAVEVNNQMRMATLAEKTFKAKLRELEFKVKSGELLPKAEVEAEAQWVAAQVKAKLDAIPPRISSMCEGRLAREIEEIITDALNNALKEFEACKYIPKPQKE